MDKSEKLRKKHSFSSKKVDIELNITKSINNSKFIFGRFGSVGLVWFERFSLVGFVCLFGLVQLGLVFSVPEASCP